MDFRDLISALSNINEDLREQSVRAVNISLTMRNWFFGFYIVEFEQNGSDRASYGQALLTNISTAMKRHGIPNTDERQLRRYRQFYLVYAGAGALFTSNDSIRNLLPKQLLENTRTIIAPLTPIPTPIPTPTPPPTLIWQSVTPVFQNNDTQTLNLFTNLSYTHFVELLQIEDPIKRLFYESECLKAGWSVRELKRQIGSLLYERTGSPKPQKNSPKPLPAKIAENSLHNLIRDPYIFEFIGLKQQEALPEKELEQALLDNLLQFLLELGKGFCFEARQRRIVIDNEHYFVDLVFYHRLLHCNVLIELKTERFHHSHAGQLNMYLEYFKKYEMAKGDNPPVGILLCTDKDQEHVEFATAGLDDKLFVSKYLVALPNKDQLQEFIKKELQNTLS